MGRINEHMSYARTRYRTLKAKFSVPFRRGVPDTDTVAPGVEMATQQNAVQTRRAEQDKQESRVRKASSKLGITVPPTAARRPETAPALERLSQLLSEED